MIKMFLQKLILFLILMKFIPEMSQEFPSPKTVEFSGYQWIIKQGKNPMGPGNNYFSGNESTVFTDEQGLHLRVDSLSKGWSAAEVISKNTFGYGEYTFKVVAPLDELNPALVLGLFLYNEHLPPFHNEIDMEFTSWGAKTVEKGFYTVHGDSADKQDVRFKFSLNGTYTTHQLVWTPDSIVFSSYHGHGTEPANRIFTWNYFGKSVPVPKAEKVHMNLWIFDKSKLKAAGATAVVIREFSFKPLNND